MNIMPFRQSGSTSTGPPSLFQADSIRTERVDSRPAGSDLIELLFRDHFESMCRLALLMLRSRAEAEDAVMEAFAKILKRHLAHRDQEMSGGYVRVAVINEVRSMIRSKEAEKGHYILLAREVPKWSQLSENAESVIAAVWSLPAQQRMAVVLYYYEDMNINEVASHLGCSSGAVKSHLARARRHLAKVLGSEFGGLSDG